MKTLTYILILLLIPIGLVTQGCGRGAVEGQYGLGLVDTVVVYDTVLIDLDDSCVWVFRTPPELSPLCDDNKVESKRDNYRGNIVSQVRERFEWVSAPRGAVEKWNALSNEEKDIRRSVRWEREPRGGWERQGRFMEKSQGWDTLHPHFRITSEYEVDSSWTDTICYERKECGE